MKKTTGNDPDRIAELIDENLKLVYSDLVQEELPDRFKDLLAVLKAQDAEKDSADKDHR
ncbi:NepR family anti-sigma factor [Rhodobacteraceae bacterium D3-12]|nr:NepR family anti-sigma factor [Rhodobacteraceae bacterium D3-12]